MNIYEGLKLYYNTIQNKRENKDNKTKIKI